MPIEDKAIEEIEDRVKESTGYVSTWLSIVYDWFKVIALSAIKLATGSLRWLLTGRWYA